MEKEDEKKMNCMNKENSNVLVKKIFFIGFLRHSTLIPEPILIETIFTSVLESM